MSGPAADLARCLARDAEAVCRRYLSNGRREGRYWIVGDVHNNRGRSLYVRLIGPDEGPAAAGKWVDAATGEHGDLLDLIRLACGCADLRGAMEEARAHLALPRPPLPARQAPPWSSSEAARRLFAGARPLAGTPALAYLRARGITAPLDGLGLRFHPTCCYRSDAMSAGIPLPALLAAVTDVAGTIIGVQRTWIDPIALTKADLPTPRKALGRVHGHGVRFGIVDDVLAAGEGLETVRSLKSVLPAMPMVACLSATHLAGLILPPTVRRLYVARDNDRAGRTAFARLRHREDLADTQVRALVPARKDFNDDLRIGGPAELLALLCRQLAPEDVLRLVAADTTA